MTLGNSSEMSAGANEMLVARDYAIMRLEYIYMLDDEQLSLCDDSEISSIAQSFHAAQVKVIASASSSEHREIFSHTATFDSKLREVKARMQTLVSPKVKASTASQPVLPKLPKINIKAFDGSLENWISFIQLFNSLVHNRTDLAPVEKLHYLLSSVHNVAYDLIKNYPVTNENYRVAYEALFRHFNKTRLIATTYYDKLIACEPVKSGRPSDLERVTRTFSENLAILKGFCLPDKNFMLVQLLWSKLDKNTKEQFELEHNSDDIPDYKVLLNFIEKRFRALDAAGFNGSNVSVAHPKNNSTNKPKTALVVSIPPCSICGQNHTIISCPTFLSYDPSARFRYVKDKRLCILCLSGSHSVKVCKSKQKCQHCRFSHNTLLHFNNSSVEVPVATGSKVLDAPSDTTNPMAMVASNTISSTLFSTARVLVRDVQNRLVPVRALLDCASACNFMSQQCANRLGLIVKQGRYAVDGIGQAVAEPAGVVSCVLSPSTGETRNTFSLEAFVLPTICSDVPNEQIDSSSWHHTRDLDLADPCLHVPGAVDMLLSVDIFASSLRPGLIHGSPGQPTAINTIFGWVLMGGCAADTCPRFRRNVCHVVTKTFSLDDSIKRFWELENVSPPGSVILSKEDQLCEDYFVAQFRRTGEGRFVVPLPFKNPSHKPIFSGSRAIALKRFLSLEKKLQNNSEFSKNYVAFMEDYVACRHLEECRPPEVDVGNFYYIPHHGVLRPLSTSTPLRVVFDASAKDAHATSLNETLLPGQKLQNNIFHLLLRFRWHNVVFTADVKQMYRQILVTPEDAEYQRILWRPSIKEPVRDYRLLTVTYGVTSAPYQALRTIAQLAHDSASEHPSGSAILARDIYVDDVVSGAQSIEEARQARSELSAILASGGFHLRKWTSNREDFFDGVPSTDLYSEDFRQFNSIDDVSLKILGLSWSPRKDVFTFKVTVEGRRCTKRTILSEIARIFDPLGFLSPVTFLAKYLMQLLWASGISWDEEAPENIATEWQAFKVQLPSLSSVGVPRRMIPDFVTLELHGFCDASERGFCAVIYCRTVDRDGACHVQLVCAKSKVAPLRKLSIPRLELLAATLLADLTASVVEALEPFHAVEQIFGWSDSSVALTWIRSCPSKWKTFVANRVSHIQDIIPPDCWRHVRTTDNPADCGSRGLLPEELVNESGWWTGPTWLELEKSDWPRSILSVDLETVHEEHRVTVLVTSTRDTLVESLLSKFSSLKTIQHILAYCLRFLHNVKSRKIPTNLRTGPLSPLEVKEALMFLVGFAQRRNFCQEIEMVQNNSANSLTKSLRKLCPFVDDAGLLRVGGRLSRASLEFDVKHPLLLARDDRLTYLLIDEYHHRFMHPGIQTLHNLLSQHFWILSPKRAIHAVISNCLKCFRVRPLGAPAPLMGDLPSYRVNKLKAFLSSAVDFGGPYDISLGRGRGNKTYKGYICVFVCTSTKAVHTELVTELSSEAFLAALRRFVARRGRCNRLVSDQGKNFVGANNILQRLVDDAAAEFDVIKFEFNPPGSPHFSGLAEAGIKAVKTHLSRVIGAQRLTYEEFSTVLTQVEALLNSRPLTPLSADPNDLSVLTPGHFLTTEPLSIVPDEDLSDTKVSVVHRWRLLQKMHQDFWSKWSREYMHTLQQRMKWHDKQPNVEKGALVLLINEQTAPMKWPLGRIVDTHPGSDGVCRVVTVRTATGIYKRPVVKLCPLPI